jgi:hypothetical protein
MKIKIRFSLYGIFSAIALFLCQETIAQPYVSNVSSILGKPFGTRTIISGILPEKSPMIENPLAISEMDGQPIKVPLIITIHGGVPIKSGERYRFEGYESGEFICPPDWLNSGAQQTFHFRNFFVVTKILN